MKFQEKFLYEIWKEKKFTSELITSENQRIEIMDPGIENKEQHGPDFINAKIRIDKITFIGDVEIDTSHSDWKHHAHFLDKKYNRVILHIVLSSDKENSQIITRDGRTVPSLCLLDFLENSFKDSIRSSILTERTERKFRLYCSDWNSKLSDNFRIGVLFDNGIKRFSKKCRSVLYRLKELIYLKEMNIREPVIKYDFGKEFLNRKFSSKDFLDKDDWNQIFYELLFEALGYSKNKEVMLKLAKSVNIKFLNTYKDEINLLEIIESSLFAVSGLLPSKSSFNLNETSEYVRNIVETWQGIKSGYDGPYLRSEQWDFFRLRPSNFPPIRIAGGSRLLFKIMKENFLKQIIDIISEEEHLKTLAYKLRKSISVKSEGYWEKHYVFDKKMTDSPGYFIGTHRADEIIVNVLLPMLSIYFDIFSNDKLLKKVKNLYINFFQVSSNKLVNAVTKELGVERLAKKSIIYQGAIDLYRNYCTKERCLECKIGEKLFN